MPPALVTSSTQSLMPSVCLFDATLCAPVCDAVNPTMRSFFTAACVAFAPGVVPPHAAATRPASASVTVIIRIFGMLLSLPNDQMGLRREMILAPFLGSHEPILRVPGDH